MYLVLEGGIRSKLVSSLYTYLVLFCSLLSNKVLSGLSLQISLVLKQHVNSRYRIFYFDASNFVGCKWYLSILNIYCNQYYISFWKLHASWQPDSHYGHTTAIVTYQHTPKKIHKTVEHMYKSWLSRFLENSRKYKIYNTLEKGHIVSRVVHRHQARKNLFRSC
jgi:hypothetical protein